MRHKKEGYCTRQDWLVAIPEGGEGEQKEREDHDSVSGPEGQDTDGEGWSSEEDGDDWVSERPGGGNGGGRPFIKGGGGTVV